MTYDPNQLRDYHGRWTDDGAGEPSVKTGVGPFDTPPDAKWPRTLTDLEDEKNKEGARRIGLAAERVADELHYDPRLITITDREYKFNLNGHDAYAAGTHLNGMVTLYMDHLSPGSIREVTAHEIEHAKYYAFLQDKEAERKEILGIPHDNVKTATLEGGVKTADVMKADGTLRPPYDEKFPSYSAYVKYVDGDNSRPHLQDKMAAEDGCTPYSKEWWDAYKAGTAKVENAYHETLAEMAAVRQRTADEHAANPDRPSMKDFAPPTLTTETHDQFGNKLDHRLLSAEYSKDWQALYDAVHRNWEKKHR